MKKITDLFLLFISMLKIGLFTFGGGYAMIHLLENEFVSKKKWIDHEEFMEKEALFPHSSHHLIRCNGHILLRAITNQNFIIKKAETYVPAFFLYFACLFSSALACATHARVSSLLFPSDSSRRRLTYFVYSSSVIFGTFVFSVLLINLLLHGFL